MDGKFPVPPRLSKGSPQEGGGRSPSRSVEIYYSCHFYYLRYRPADLRPIKVCAIDRSIVRASAITYRSIAPHIRSLKKTPVPSRGRALPSLSLARFDQIIESSSIVHHPSIIRHPMLLLLLSLSLSQEVLHTVSVIHHHPSLIPPG